MPAKPRVMQFQQDAGDGIGLFQRTGQSRAGIGIERAYTIFMAAPPDEIDEVCEPRIKPG